MADCAQPTAAALADLTWLNVGDIVSAFGLGADAPLRGLAELAARPPARRFAGHMLALDAAVGAAGLGAGGAWICARYSRGLEGRGEPAPATGPLLVAANHPGLLDAAALFSAIGRDDLRVLAITRPLLRALPNIAARLFPVGATAAARTAAVRAAARHLRAGGALLTFPAGRIEPDPLAQGGAEASVAAWSASLDLLARLAGPLTAQVAIVGGVRSPAALRHPLTRLRRAPEQRQYLAAILQLLRPARHPVRVRVQLGRPLAVADGPLRASVTAEARRLIAALARL